MKKKVRQQLNNRKRRMERRLQRCNLGDTCRPVFGASGIQYEISDRVRAISSGGIGLIHTLAQRVGLVDAIDEQLHLLKFPLPYHESDHVLTFAYNALCDGTCLQDLELRRNDEVFLDALGARRIPDPTTAGDFCRRFDEASIRTLQEAVHAVRRRVWSEQPREFFDQATLDVDGTLISTTGQCKAGMDIAYDGTWGYHALVLSLANTGEILGLVNRSGNRPSHEGAAAEIDRAVEVCFGGGFQKVLLRGDTDFSQTEQLDRWNADHRVRFVFGYEAAPNLKALAAQIAERHWRPLDHPARTEVATQPRQRPDNVKEQKVIERQYDNIKLTSEAVSEFNYQPTACDEEYRMVVLRKHLSIHKGQREIRREVRYFFFITNDWMPEADEIVRCAHGRCDQENLLAQLKSGVRALCAPVNTLESNWAFMVMTALAWDLKAWWALLLPEEPGRWKQRHSEQKLWVLRLEFKTFVSAFVRIPAQIVRTGRRLIYRLLGWNPHLPIFFRLVDRLRG